MVTYTSVDFELGQARAPFLVPFANGTPPDRETPLRDTNDALFIGANLCSSVRSTLNRACQCQFGPLFFCVDEPPPAALLEPIDCTGQPLP